MNAFGFASSRDAGGLVLSLVGLITLALLVAIWTLDRWRTARRLARAQQLRLQRADRHRLAPVAVRVSGSTAPPLRVAGSAERARAGGVDELQLEDDFAGFAEYGGGVRH